MPKQKILGTYKVREDIDESEIIKAKIEEARSYLKKKLEEANSIQNQCYKNICMFSLIDSLAQEYADYPTQDAQKTFCDFVIKYQDRYSYLGKVEPVTLFYDYEPYIREIERHPELRDIVPELCSKEKEISLMDLRLEDEKKVEEIIDSDKAKELLNLIERDYGVNTAEKFKKRHTLINLLYKMRSKSVHELSRMGGANNWEIQAGYDEPFYRDMSRIYTSNGNIVSDNIFELVFPSGFIYNLAANVIGNYLSECDKQQRLPFENNSNFRRDVTYTWNDKKIIAKSNLAN